MEDRLELKDLHDTICLVTGANSGIGKETAKGLVRLGAHVIMVCRDPERGRDAQAEVQAYGQSKLANILFTHELARRLHDSGVTANCVHPGVVATNIWRGQDWLSRIARLFTWLYKSPEEGAESVLYLAASRAMDGVTGQYYKEMEAVNPSPEAYDEKAAARLWRRSLELTGLEDSVEQVERGPGSP